MKVPAYAYLLMPWFAAAYIYIAVTTAIGNIFNATGE